VSGMEVDTRTAERSVLGGMLLAKRVVWDVVDEVEPGDFADGRHETIFRTIVALAQENRPTDVIAVTEQLATAGELERVGGAALLHELTDEVPTAANAGYYASIVRRHAIKRRLFEVGQRVAQMGQATEGDAYELVEHARREVDAVASAARSEIAPVGDSVEGVVDALRTAPRFTPTPWTSLNGLINGFRPGAMYVIGARPGSGKTIMGLQAAVHLARSGTVAFSSLEMDTADLTRRIFAMRGGVHMTSLTRNALTPTDWERIGALRPEVRKMPLFIDDRSGATMTQIKAHARSVARRGQLSAIVVDYLQLIRATDPKRPRWEVVGEFSRELKIMARELEVPVIALCQLNRESEQGGRRLPTLSDLRESGSIEQDADVVLLLQRGWDEQREEHDDQLNVVIAKNRHGSTGKISLFWEGHFARVSDIPW